MYLHCAVAKNGLLNASESLLLNADSCSLVAFRDVLYCFYLVEPTRVFYISKTVGGAWSLPEDVGIESLTGLPIPVVYNDTLYVFGSGIKQMPDRMAGTFAKVAIFDPVNRNFEVKASDPIYGKAAIVERKGILYKIARGNGAGLLNVRSSIDGNFWYPKGGIFPNGSSGSPAISTSDPVACLYQGLIHVFFQSSNGLELIRFDGEGWGASQLFIEKHYAHMPSVTVHDGLLTLAFADAEALEDNSIPRVSVPIEQAMGVRESERPEGGIDLYRYDGLALSKVDRSVNIKAGGAPAIAGVSGLLHVIYPSD